MSVLWIVFFDVVCVVNGVFLWVFWNLYVLVDEDVIIRLEWLLIVINVLLNVVKMWIILCWILWCDFFCVILCCFVVIIKVLLNN